MNTVFVIMIVVDAYVNNFADYEYFVRDKHAERNDKRNETRNEGKQLGGPLEDCNT